MNEKKKKKTGERQDEVMKIERGSEIIGKRAFKGREGRACV